MLIGHQAVAFAAKRFLPQYSLGTLLVAATFLDMLSAVALFMFGGQPGGAGVAGGYPLPTQAHTAAHALTVAAACSAVWVCLLRLRGDDWKPTLAVGFVVFSHWLLDVIAYPSGLQLYLWGASRFGWGNWYTEGFALALEGAVLAGGLWLYLSGTEPRDLLGRYGGFAYACVLAGGYLAIVFRLLPPDDQLLVGFSVSSCLLPWCAAWFDEHRSMRESAGVSWRAAVWGPLLAFVARLQMSFKTNRARDIDERSSPPAAQPTPQTGHRVVLRPHVKRGELAGGPGGESAVEPAASAPDKAVALPGRRWPLGIVLRLSSLILLPLLAAFIANALVRYAYAWTNPGEVEVARRTGLLPRDDFDATFKAAGEPDPAEKAIEEQPSILQSALRQYRIISDDVASVIDEGLEGKMRIGGALAVATTNWQFNKGRWVFRTPEELGFERITDKQSLVDCVKRGDVSITALRLTGRPGRPYKFFIKVKGMGKTKEPVPCLVPKGQIFELDGPSLLRHLAGVGIEEGKNLTQVYVNTEPFQFDVQPSGEYEEEKIAYCGNAGLDPPNGDGNLTIFKIADTDFKSQGELHGQMDARNRRELLKESGGGHAGSLRRASAGEVALHTPPPRRIVR